MKILLVSASASKKSINYSVLKKLSKDLSLPVLDLLDFSSQIPLLLETYKPEIPQKIQVVFDVLRQYKKIIFFTPEHNGYFSAFFKNILDWLSLLKRDFLEGIDTYVVSVSSTKKDVRNLEIASKQTFSNFSPNSFLFINFNNYESSNISLSYLKSSLNI